MATRVDASTIAAGQLFSTSRFQIPDFQRTYSWSIDKEVQEFWSDLKAGIASPPYFLGLLIVTEEEPGVKTVVDGQQRLTTLSLLANAVRKAAVERGKLLIADSMRDLFLFSLDYESESRVPRLSARADGDRAALSTVLADGPGEGNSLIHRAQDFLIKELRADLEAHDSSSRLAEWAKFVTSGLVFALFEHPDRNAAFKVFEVVNTRGKDLTPAELIKSYLLSSVEEVAQKSVYDRWTALEERFDQLQASSQFTQFVRHVATLTVGYVIPRDLYQAINENFQGPAGVEVLLQQLERRAAVYSAMVDPSSDSLETSDLVSNAFAILETLNLRTVRPVFMAACDVVDADEAVQALLQLVVVRSAMGTFGTGSVERQFADAALRIASGSAAWPVVVSELREGLAPTRKNFEQRVRESALPKSMIHVLRSSVEAEASVPKLIGYPHQIRPENGDNWANFDAAAYRQVGGTLGNYLLLDSQRRPRNTHTPDGASERLLPLIAESRAPYLSSLQLADFSERRVEEINAELAEMLGAIWY